MKKLAKLTLVLMSSALFYSTAYSTNIPNTDNPKTFLGPTARVGFTSTLGDYSAYSVAGEAGIKNFRVGGTLGWKLTEFQRLKVSAEFLRQEITYAFFSGNTDQWMNQGAIGAAYQYDFADYSYRPQFELSAYGSHAPSKSLNTVTGTFTNAGMPTKFVDTRRIAGSNGAGIAPGLAITPWTGGRLSAAVNYDSVRYNKNYSPGENAVGLGGTLGFSQALTDTLSLGLAAEVRQPFNNYAANLSWSDVPYFDRWTLALFGDYTVGKSTLPNTYNVGLSANYFLDRRCGQPVPVNWKGERNLKGEVELQPYNDGLLAWAADPAVYMPQVLAVVDEKIKLTILQPIPVCTSVAYIGPADPSTDFPEPEAANAEPFTFNFGPLFTGSSPIKFSINVTIVFGSGNASDFSINPNTGLVSYNSPGDDGGVYIVSVTGTNNCGTDSVTFFFAND